MANHPSTLEPRSGDAELPLRALELDALQSHPHIMLTGPAAATDAVLNLLKSRLWPEVRECDSREPFSLLGKAGTVVLRHADALDAMQQAALLRCLDASDRAIQVVTVTREALLPLVDQGEFLDALFYRLNMVHVQCDAAGCA